MEIYQCVGPARLDDSDIIGNNLYIVYSTSNIAKIIDLEKLDGNNGFKKTSWDRAISTQIFSADINGDSI